MFFYFAGLYFGFREKIFITFSRIPKGKHAKMIKTLVIQSYKNQPKGHKLIFQMIHLLMVPTINFLTVSFFCERCLRHAGVFHPSHPLFSPEFDGGGSSRRWRRRHQSLCVWYEVDCHQGMNKGNRRRQGDEDRIQGGTDTGATRAV